MGGRTKNPTTLQTLRSLSSAQLSSVSMVICIYIQSYVYVYLSTSIKETAKRK
jgi:hypothetical protein